VPISHLSRLFRTARVRAGLSLGDVAVRMGAANVGKQASRLGNVEAGQRSPHPNVVRRIGISLGISETEINEVVARDEADLERDRRARFAQAVSDPRPRAYFKIAGLTIGISPPADVDPDNLEAVVAWAAAFASERHLQAMVVVGEKTFCIGNGDAKSSVSKAGDAVASNGPFITMAGSNVPLRFELTTK